MSLLVECWNEDKHSNDFIGDVSLPISGLSDGKKVRTYAERTVACTTPEVRWTTFMSRCRRYVELLVVTKTPDDNASRVYSTDVKLTGS